VQSGITAILGLAVVQCMASGPSATRADPAARELVGAEHADLEAVLAPALGNAPAPAAGLGLRLFGGQEITAEKRLLVVTSSLPQFENVTKRATYLRYFLVVHDRSAGEPYRLAGEFWAVGGPTPFSGGPLLEGLPVIFDVIQPNGYEHYVHWRGRYQPLSALPHSDLRQLIDRLFDDPHTYKYPLDWSEGSSRFAAD
jgi:hypothetical protein